MDRESGRQLVRDTLAAAGLEVDEVGEDRWMTVLAGEWKRTIPVMLHLDDRSLHVSSLFCGAPDENLAEVYAILLHRNQRPLPVRFALDDDDDVVLVGQVPREVLDAERLDGLLGAVLATADEAYNAVLRVGFATYLAAEQRWRARNGLPPNPVSEVTGED